MHQPTTISSVHYNSQPSPDIYSQYGMERIGTDAATDQLCQSISSITVSDKENGINEPHWYSPCSQYTDSSCYTYTNPAEHQLVSMGYLMNNDHCVQQCEVSHINSLRNGECWDSYECYGLNNNVEVMQPTLFYLLTSGCIANFGKDEKGSRFVQEEFAKSSPAVRQMMFDYLFERGGFDWFSNDPHGNFIIQARHAMILSEMEAFPGIEQARIAEHVANKVVKMCSNRYGSRIMQRIFERFDFGYRVELLNKLSGSECFLAVDSCATHVMQKLFALFPPTKYSFVVIALTLSKENFKQVVQNKYGCRVIQSALEELEISACTTRYANNPNEFKAARRLLSKLLRRLTENCMEFTDHQFANYVMQHVISSEFHAEARDYIIKHAILSNVLTLSQEKFASHVVEKSLKHASPKLLHCLMSEIFDGYVKDDKGRDALDIMLFDQYGNYVVQTMINVSIDVHNERREGDLIWLARLSERISRHETRLLRYSSGKKIIEKMKQVF
uniref:PUM-HD domain-containing protein n=1 Tax=Elaeophora elaphi TaxID=1147741 RepID=A0A0R3RTG4_9BILA